jgi:hypothetical protein
MVYKHGKHEIEIFDSIHKLPFLRFQRFNKYQMQSIEIGSSFQDYDNRSAKIIQFLKKDMIEEAIKEMENRRQTVFNAYNDFSPIGKSMAVLIKRIDDVQYNDFTPDDLDRCLQHLTDIGFDIATSIEKLMEVKKKSKRNWLSIFQSSFQKAETAK